MALHQPQQSPRQRRKSHHQRGATKHQAQRYRVNDRVGCRISLRSSLVLCPTLRPCGFASCASLVLRRTLRPCGVVGCSRRWGHLCHEIRSLRRLVRSVVGINDQPSFATWLLYWRRSPDWRRSVISNELRHQQSRVLKRRTTTNKRAVLRIRRHDS